MLFARERSWEGKQLISRGGVEKSTRADTATDPALDYQHYWGLNTLNGEDRHFYASGKYGQYIYVDPEKDLVIVRLGKEEGERACSYWISLFDDLVTKLGPSVEGSS